MAGRPVMVNWIRRLKGGLIGFSLVAAVGIGFLFFQAQRVQAFSTDLAAANSHYPFISGSRLNDCTLCHQSGSFSLNPYGTDYKDNARNFGAIESLDSDGDGFSNLVELMALSFPGNASDVPAEPTPTNTPFPPMTETPTPTGEPPTATPTGETPEPTPTDETPLPTPTEPGETPTPTPTDEVAPTPEASPTLPPAEGFDLDIHNFKVASDVNLEKVKPIKIQLDVKNYSASAGDGMATITGVQNGVEVYNVSLAVSDIPGNGHRRYFFPSYVPTASGEILWTATLSDENPDMDEWTATTMVSGEAPGDGGEGSLDLDIQHFKVTSKIKLNRVKAVELRLDVKNNGSADGQAMVTLIGMQNGVEVYNQTMAVSDPVGGGHSTYFFASYAPVASGDIVWTVTLSDADPDEDMLMAITRVDP